jgi:hypothetical protein
MAKMGGGKLQNKMKSLKKNEPYLVMMHSGYISLPLVYNML